MSDVRPPAPLLELKLAKSIHRYERIKLALLIAVVLFNILIGLYLVHISNEDSTSLNQTHQTLVILRCAVSKEVRTLPNGKPTTPDEARVAFDTCIKRGGPVGP